MVNFLLRKIFRGNLNEAIAAKEIASFRFPRKTFFKWKLNLTTFAFPSKAAKSWCHIFAEAFYHLFSRAPTTWFSIITKNCLIITSRTSHSMVQWDYADELFQNAGEHSNFKYLGNIFELESRIYDLWWEMPCVHNFVE